MSFVNKPVPQTWSNRLGVTLTPATTGIWVAERPFTWNKIDVGGRSVICRVGDGQLLVHSPVEWNENLDDCLKALGGGVGYVVSPNYEHLKYAKAWSDAYPDAKMIACPGLPERLPDIRWDVEIGNNDRKILSTEFQETIEYVHFDCEINPATNRPFFNEVVWFHVKSKSMFCSDIYWNYPSSSLPNYYGIEGTGDIHQCPKMPVLTAPTNGQLPEVKVPFGTKLWKVGMDKVYLPFYKRIMVSSIVGR